MNHSYMALFIAYCAGSLSFAIIVSKFMKLNDPRSYGSNNAGATNVMRSGNKKAALLTLIGDLLKGTIVVLVFKHLFNHNIDVQTITALAGVLVVIGHIYPLFFKFKGGKGVATAFGVMLGFNPILALLLVVTWGVVFKISKISSLSALTATVLSPVYAFLLMGNNTYFGATLVIAFFVLYKHKENVFRLFSGQEHKFKKSEE
jgi:glycerol-3-phosphate acyltransferase PlsY